MVYIGAREEESIRQQLAKEKAQGISNPELEAKYQSLYKTASGQLTKTGQEQAQKNLSKSLETAKQQLAKNPYYLTGYKQGALAGRGGQAPQVSYYVKPETGTVRYQVGGTMPSGQYQELRPYIDRSTGKSIAVTSKQQYEYLAKSPQARQQISRETEMVKRANELLRRQEVASYAQAVSQRQKAVQELKQSQDFFTVQPNQSYNPLKQQQVSQRLQSLSLEKRRQLLKKYPILSTLPLIEKGKAVSGKIYETGVRISESKRPSDFFYSKNLQLQSSRYSGTWQGYLGGLGLSGVGGAISLIEPQTYVESGMVLGTAITKPKETGSQILSSTAQRPEVFIGSLLGTLAVGGIARGISKNIGLQRIGGKTTILIKKPGTVSYGFESIKGRLKVGLLGKKSIIQSESISNLPIVSTTSVALSKAKFKPVGIFAEEVSLFQSKAYSQTIKKESMLRAEQQLKSEILTSKIKLTPEVPSKIRKAFRQDIISKRSIKPLDIKPVGIFSDKINVPVKKVTQIKINEQKAKPLPIPFQSLFYAGKNAPSEYLAKSGKVYGFTNLESAEAWAKSKGYKNIYQYQTKDYIIDPQIYSRNIKKVTPYKDIEFISKDVTSEKLVRYFPSKGEKIRAKKELLAEKRQQVESLILKEARTSQRSLLSIPKSLRKQIRKDIIAKRSIKPLDIKPIGSFSEALPLYQSETYYKQKMKELGDFIVPKGISRTKVYPKSMILYKPFKVQRYGEYFNPSYYKQRLIEFGLIKVPKKLKQTSLFEKLISKKPSKSIPPKGYKYIERKDTLTGLVQIQLVKLNEPQQQNKIRTKTKQIQMLRTEQKTQQQQVQLLKSNALQESKSISSSSLSQLIGLKAIAKSRLSLVLGVVPSMKSKQVTRSTVKLNSLQQTSQKSELIQIPIQKQSLDLSVGQIQGFMNSQAISQTQSRIQSQAQNQAQQQGLFQRSMVKTQQLNLQKSLRIKIPESDKQMLTTTKSKKPKKSFAVFIRKGGKFSRVSSKAFTKQAALDVGAMAVKSKLSATFKLQEVQETPVDIRTTGAFKKFAPSFREYQIRKGQKISTPLQFIEKRGTRLTTQQERRAIKSARQQLSTLRLNLQKPQTETKSRGKSKWF